MFVFCECVCIFCSLCFKIMPIFWLKICTNLIFYLFYTIITKYLRTFCQRTKPFKMQCGFFILLLLFDAMLSINPSSRFAFDSVSEERNYLFNILNIMLISQMHYVPGQMSFRTTIWNIWIELWPGLITIFHVIFKCGQKQ